MKAWIDRYDEADVILDGAPANVGVVAAACAIMVSSPSRRCLQSVRYLCPNRELLSEEVFREADLPHLTWRFPRLPLAVFAVGFRLAWFRGFSTNAESLSQATIRARMAAERMTELARQNGSVFLMGHGIMAILIARHLCAWGWSGPRRPINRNWQYSIYEAPAHLHFPLTLTPRQAPALPARLKKGEADVAQSG